MRAKIFGRALAALVIGLFSVSPAAAADDCLCTQRVDFKTSDGPQNWSVTADASGSLKVTLVLGISTTDTGDVNPDHLNASIYGPDGAWLHTIAIAGSVEGWVRGAFTVAPTIAGDVYRVEIHRSTPHPSPAHASRYWLRLDGADDAAIASPLRALNGGRTTWTFFADASDAMGVRIFDPFTYPNPPGDYPVMFQWIAPDGTAQPVGSYTVTGPGMDTMIPPPAGLVPGKWRLRLQTLSLANVGWGYAIEKTTGVDRRLHVEPGLAGLSNGGRVRFVGQSGAPFTDPVGFSAGFGETFTFPVSGGEFVTTNDSDVFPIPIAITPPAGMIATPPQFAFELVCDGFVEQTVVISAAPPALTVASSPGALWPPNHKMVTVNVDVDTSPDATIELVSITSNEPGVADDVAGAMFGTDDRTFQLRAERLGGGDGRIYTITYRATNAAGGSATATTTVVVAHDQGKKK